jgi:hypothetical protein
MEGLPVSELDSTIAPAPAAGPFNPVDAAIGVITRPVPAMQQIAAARPWLIGLGLYLIINLLSGFAGLTAPATVLPPDANMPPELEQMLEGLIGATRSVPLILGLSLIVSPILLVIWVGILYLVGRLFGGQGAFSAVFATHTFATIPNILLAAATALLNLAGDLLAPLLGALSFGVGIWILVLQIIGMRESMALSTGRAVAAVLIPIAVLILLACVLAVIAVAVIVSAVSSSLP